MRPNPAVPLIVGAAVLTLSACSGGNSGSGDVSVFSVKPGQCFQTPKDVKAELAKLHKTPCTDAHTQEAYAVVRYVNSSGATPSTYPGSDVLTTFAQGTCAQRYSGYVGVDYLDSTLYFTYLLPSARSWEQDSDRNVICFVTTTGGTLKKSVKGSKQ